MQEILQQSIEELKVKLSRRLVTEDSLEGCLKQKGFMEDELNYVKDGMLKQGFSFLNGMVIYRGDVFVSPIPPNVVH